MITAATELEDVFASTPGSVLVLTKQAKTGFRAEFTGANGPWPLEDLSTYRSYSSMKCLVTGISLNESANFQFMSTLRNMTYLYSFGDKIAELDVSGIAFLNPECDGESGVHRIYDFILHNKMSSTLKPITLSLISFAKGIKDAGDTITLQAFLGSSNISISDPSSMYAQFSLKMYYMPKSSSTPWTDSFNNFNFR